MKTLMIVSCVLLSLTGCGSDVGLSTQEDDIQLQSPGEIAADVRLQVAPPSVRGLWQYTIKEMAPERALVQQGDLLVAFDDEYISQKLAEKSAELTQARQELTNRRQADAKAQQDLQIAKAEKQMLADKDKRKADIVDHSRSELDRKKMQIDAQISANDLALATLKLTKTMQQAQFMQKMLESKVERLATELAEQQADQQKMTIKAPFSGVVSYQENFSDEKFSVGDKVQFGQTVLELNQLDSLYVSATIDEVHLARLSAGTVAQIRVDSLPDLQLSGQLRPLKTVIRDKSYNDQRRVFDAQISLPQPASDKLRPGMTARLQFGQAPASDRTHAGVESKAGGSASQASGSQP